MSFAVFLHDIYVFHIKSFITYQILAVLILLMWNRSCIHISFRSRLFLIDNIMMEKTIKPSQDEIKVTYNTWIEGKKKISILLSEISDLNFTEKVSTLMSLHMKYQQLLETQEQEILLETQEQEILSSVFLYNVLLLISLFISFNVILHYPQFQIFQLVVE